MKSSTSFSMEPSLVFMSILLGQLKVITLVLFGFAIRPIAAAAVSTLPSNVCACSTCSLIDAISSAKSRSVIHTGLILRVIDVVSGTLILLLFRLLLFQVHSPVL